MNQHTHQPVWTGVDLAQGRDHTIVMVTEPTETIVRINNPLPGFVEVTDGRRLHLNPQPKPQHWLTKLLA